MPDLEQLAGDSADALAWQADYRHWLAQRTRWLVPRLAVCHSVAANVLGPRALYAAWRLADDSLWRLWINLDSVDCTLPAAHGILVAESRQGAAEALAAGRLLAESAVVLRQAASSMER